MVDVEYEYDWLHFLSGVDFPTKHNSYIDAYFENTAYKGFMGFDKPEYYNLFLTRRLMCFHLDDIIGHRPRLTSLQLYLISKGIKLRSPFRYSLYKGSNWFSWDKEIVSYVVEYSDNHPEYLKRFKWTTCCDEVFFHTIVMNSLYANSICKNNLRFIDWKAKVPNESLPRVLNESDFTLVVQNADILFCRKLDLIKSKSLINLLKNHISLE